MKLKHRLYGLTLLVSLLPLFICGFVMLYQSRSNVEDVVSRNLEVTCNQQISTIENFCEQVKGDMQVAANYSFIHEELLISLGELPYTDETGRAYIEDLLEGHTGYSPYLQSMAIVDSEFHVIAASEAYHAGEISDLQNVMPVMLSGEFHMGNVYTREIQGEEKAVVLACLGVFEKDRLIGYVVAEILTDYFAKYHEDNQIIDHAVLQILDEKEKVITIGGEGKDSNTFYYEQQMHDSQVRQKRRTEGFTEQGSLSYRVNGKHFVTLYAELEYSDWLIRVTVNTSNYIKQGASYFVLLAAVFLIGAFLMVAVNFFITENMTQPMDKICARLKEVQDTGDYSLRVDINSTDEIGELQCEINHLLSCVSEARMNEMKGQEELARKVEQDPMTGVYNKKAIGCMIDEKIKELMNYHGRIAVAFVDIDDFKNYNTNYGHVEGDHVIRFVANTIRESIPGYAGRYGGDEFVFCMEAQDREIVEQTLTLLMYRLERGVINSVTGERMSVPCSIGVVFEEAGKNDGNTLIHDADEAMYVAKEKGKNTFYIVNR